MTKPSKANEDAFAKCDRRDRRRDEAPARRARDDGAAARPRGRSREAQGALGRALRRGRVTTVVYETHSTSEHNEAGIATGWLGGALSAAGRAQAVELGERRRDDGIELVVASDLMARGRDRGDRLRGQRHSAAGRLAAARVRLRRAERHAAPVARRAARSAGRRAVARRRELAARRSRACRRSSTRCAASACSLIGHVATTWALDHRVHGRRSRSSPPRSSTGSPAGSTSSRPQSHPVRACKPRTTRLTTCDCEASGAGSSLRGLRGRTVRVRCGVRRELHLQAHHGRRHRRGLDDPSQGGLPRAVSVDRRPREAGRDAEHGLVQRLHTEGARPRRGGGRGVDVPQRQSQRGRRLAGEHVPDGGDGSEPTCSDPCA